MQKIRIKGFRREKTGKESAKKLRKEGVIPAIVYSKDTNIPIKIPFSELKEIRAHHFSESSLIEIEVENSEKETFSAIIKDVQFHPLTEEVIHIDFLKVSMEERIKVKVPVVLKGEAKGVKEGGILEQILWELEIEALPLDIPEKVEVDISSLGIGHSIHVGDLNLKEGIRLLQMPQETVVTIVAKEEEVEEVAEGEGVEAPEAPQEPKVIKEKKPKEEES
jgi:large subunit ribosomal protein L25